MKWMSTLEQRKLILWLRSKIKGLENQVDNIPQPDMSSYYTKSEVDIMIGDVETLLSGI